MKRDLLLTRLAKEYTSLLRISKHIITWKTIQTPVDNRQKRGQIFLYSCLIRPEGCFSGRVVYRTRFATTFRGLWVDGLEARLAIKSQRGTKILPCDIY